MEDGWYLMNTAQLERVLSQWRKGDEPETPPGASRLSIDEALRFRDSGNIPDADDRSLRLVLHVSDRDVGRVAERRVVFEPDFHSAPSWRKNGSRAVNVVPLRTADATGTEPIREAWWEEPELGALEEEWVRTGTVAGLQVPAEYRSFVYKTVISLREAGREVTADSVADSIARWLPDDVEEIRAALKKKGAGFEPGSPRDPSTED